MSRLPTPIRKSLREISPSQHELARMWSGVLRRSESSRQRVWIASLAATAACAVALLAWSGHLGNPLHRTRRGEDAGPLYLADHRAIDGLTNAASARTARAEVLSDGSQLVLLPGTALELLENSGQRFSVLLQHGLANFQVRPGGPRRWIIEAGLATVEVVGTRFAVERQSGRLDVRVDEGVVLVHGDLVPGRAQRLRAGAVLTVVEPALQPAEPVPSVVAPKPKGSPLFSKRQALAPEHDSAREAPAQDSVRKQLTLPLSLDELLTLADAARRSGHPAEALPLIQQAIEKFPADKRVALLAFTRGRIYFDDLHQPGSAAQAFAQALALGLPRALSEDAYALLVEARFRANDRAGALEAAREYRARFPDGHLRERIAHLVQAP